jgi:hypothetical protein
MDISILEKHSATMCLQQIFPKCWYPLKTITQKTTIKKLTTMRMSDFILSINDARDSVLTVSSYLNGMYD